MSKAGDVCRTYIKVLIFLAIAIPFGLYFVYQTKIEGELVLGRAPGKVTIEREADSLIMHIKGDDWVSVAYGQGFATA